MSEADVRQQQVDEAIAELRRLCVQFRNHLDNLDERIDRIDRAIQALDPDYDGEGVDRG